MRRLDYLEETDDEIERHFRLEDGACGVAIERARDQRGEEDIHVLRLDKVAERRARQLLQDRRPIAERQTTLKDSLGCGRGVDGGRLT